ncbi:MAG: hypothetical protein BWK75_02030, partial [Candidatus Altiarchaeales archaeon A3]
IITNSTLSQGMQISNAAINNNILTNGTIIYGITNITVINGEAYINGTKTNCTSVNISQTTVQILTQCVSCMHFDFDNSGDVDIFDAVTALEYLSGERNEISNEECSVGNHNKIDLFDIFALIEEIGSS